MSEQSLRLQCRQWPGMGVHPLAKARVMSNSSQQCSMQNDSSTRISITYAYSAALP